MSNDGGMAAYLFHQGTNTYAYEYLGASRVRSGEGYDYVFRTWAPNADEVSLVSDFTGWDSPVRMERVTERGVYELIFHSERDLDGSAYKYLIRRGGRSLYKGDPYARYCRTGLDGASILFTSTYRFSDESWYPARRKAILGENGRFCPSPISIYEVHAASFARREDGGFLSYRELCDLLLPYVKSMGFTHVEFLPLAEYPYDGSWGYQVCGFYAPTSRFGDPDGLRYLVDTFHRNGVGVILDWVPAHFPKDEWGLYEFDGAPLYEYQGKDRQESRSWGTRFFDLGREEVQSFLISNALYFFREFHVDGLRVDAVASMLYLDYDREPDEWIPNANGTNINLEAVAFFRKLNTAVFAENPDALMIAEESTSFSSITKPVHEGGLGFNFKWNMGFANDLFDYVATDPYFRAGKHSALNFPLMYAFTENYILPISHDEVVHGKKSLIDKCCGGYEEKFSTARALLLLQMTYPGKKMIFMGCEFAQFREWDFEHSLEWFMLDYPAHRAFREYVASLLRLYLERPELYELDFTPDGFEWILPDESEKNLVAYRRKSISGKALTVVVSFSGTEQTVRIPCTKDGLSPLFVSVETGALADGAIRIGRIRNRYYANITVPPLSGMILTEEANQTIVIKENENVL